MAAAADAIGDDEAMGGQAGYVMDEDGVMTTPEGSYEVAGGLIRVNTDIDLSEELENPQPTGIGNPGNDKDVGRAGETPNGRDGWGSGSRGRSS